MRYICTIVGNMPGNFVGVLLPGEEGVRVVVEFVDDVEVIGRRIVAREDDWTESRVLVISRG